MLMHKLYGVLSLFKEKKNKKNLIVLFPQWGNKLKENKEQMQKRKKLQILPIITYECVAKY